MHSSIANEYDIQYNLIKERTNTKCKQKCNFIRGYFTKVVVARFLKYNIVIVYTYIVIYFIHTSKI